MKEKECRLSMKLSYCKGKDFIILLKTWRERLECFVGWDPLVRMRDRLGIYRWLLLSIILLLKSNYVIKMEGLLGIMKVMISLMDYQESWEVMADMLKKSLIMMLASGPKHRKKTSLKIQRCYYKVPLMVTTYAYSLMDKQVVVKHLPSKERTLIQV